MGLEPTVLPEPLYPTIRVSGVLKAMVSECSGPKERTPIIESFSILDMALAQLFAENSSGR